MITIPKYHLQLHISLCVFYIHIYVFFTCDGIALHSFTLTHEIYLFLLYTYPLNDLYI
jgi:hypothetical protein